MNGDMERRIDQLQAAADNAAGHVRNLYITFLLFGMYLIITVAATTDEQLLRSEPVNLPIVNVELPLFGFYWVAPALYVLLHFNLLIQFSLLASKLHRFDQWIETHVKVASERAARRDLVGLLAFSHMLIGSHHRASLRFFLRWMMFISVIFMPVAILLFTQFRFLPYHSVATAWAHRAFVLIDLLLILLLWLKIRYPRDDVRDPSSRWFGQKLLPLLGVFSTIGISIGMAVPGEPQESMLGRIGGYGYGSLFSLNVRDTNLVTAWPTSQDIEELGRDFAWQTVGDSISLPGRDLRYASFIGTTLVSADLKGADLRFASFFKANLNFADLRDAKLNPANFRDAALRQADLYRADLTGADLSKAYLERAYLGHANLLGARLVEAELGSARLYRANLSDADLSKADLGSARLREAKLTRANLSDAKLDWTDLHYADLTDADVSGVLFNDAKLCATTMPDGTSCNRDCDDGDRSCPWLAGAGVK